MRLRWVWKRERCLDVSGVGRAMKYETFYCFLTALATVGALASVGCFAAPPPSSSPAASETSSPAMSASIEFGKPFTYGVGHCGLRHIVEFDGSYWDVDPSTVGGDENARFGTNSDVGIMTLVAADEAVYHSSRGGDATLRRHFGRPEFGPCF